MTKHLKQPQIVLCTGRDLKRRTVCERDKTNRPCRKSNLEIKGFICKKHFKTVYRKKKVIKKLYFESLAGGKLETPKATACFCIFDFTKF